MGKPKKTSCNKNFIYKHLVHQQVQQVVHNLRDVLLLQTIWFLKNAETSPLKCNIYLSLFIAILRLFYNALCTLVSSSEKIIIYSCYNHSFQTNEVSLFNVVAFNIALFDVALFQYCIIFTVSCCTFFIVHCLMFPYLMLHYLMMHDFHVVLFVGALFNLYHINILLLNVALFHCCTVSMLHFIILRY